MTKNQGFFLYDYLDNLWVAVKANFGGKPNLLAKSNTKQIVVFTWLLVGSIVWMAYRASFTSVLSIIKLQLPFNDLESLSKSDYK